jgi:hypothetical protein
MQHIQNILDAVEGPATIWGGTVTYASPSKEPDTDTVILIALYADEVCIRHGQMALRARFFTLSLGALGPLKLTSGATCRLIYHADCGLDALTGTIIYHRQDESV